MQDIFETRIFAIFKSIKKVNCLNKHENDTEIPVEINIHLTGTLEKKDKQNGREVILKEILAENIAELKEKNGSSKIYSDCSAG